MSFGVDVRNSIGIGLSGAMSVASRTSGSTELTIVSAVISEDGTTLTLVFSENVSIGAGGNGGFALSASGGAATLTFAGGGV